MLVDDFLARIQGYEKDFVGREFLAPIVGTARVLVRITGVIYQLRVSYGLPDDFMGWAVLRSISMSEAVFSRCARLSEIAGYLERLPSLRLVLVQDDQSYWQALPTSYGDVRFLIQQPVHVWLVEEGLQLFESIIARFDGRSFWFDRRDPQRDPALGAYLRRQLRSYSTLGSAFERNGLHKPGLSKEEKDAFHWVLRQKGLDEKDRIEARFADALSHAGARFHSYTQRSSTYVVRYEVDGRDVISTVRDEDLSVVTAGMCLQGQDSRFDLTSLVSVLREGRRRHAYGV
jgi:hypothetical protein